MSDSRYINKSPRKHREDVSKPKMRKSKYHSRKDSSHRLDCRTPPLPTTRGSLDELLKERDTLKEELERMAKKTDKYDLEIRHNLNEGNINTVMSSHKTIKRSSLEERDSHNSKKNRKSIENLSDHEVEHSDSEDEESIIAKRRMQRQQLLDKLNSHPDSFNYKEFTDDDDQMSTISANQNVELGSKPSPNKSEPIIETTDMFSEKDFPSSSVADTVTQDNCNVQLSDNWDNEEGYYKIIVGDIIDNNKYTIKSILGQGVFANVVLAQETKTKTDVAIKIMRNNELIYKTGLKELSLLKRINDADPNNKYHCIKFLDSFMHKGHLCVVLEPLYMDLRRIIKKYGRHGLNMKAVMSYSRQLLLALRLLKKIGVVHADVKPDNILVNEKKNVLKLCDFGSASKVNENEITPYLVSRFYRSPEIILGISHNFSIDVWSAACTMFEIATGRILFIGTSNNKMLKCFMDLKGKFPSKLIRRGKFKDQHFNYNNNLLLHKKDELSGREKYVEMINVNATRDILQELKKSHCSSEENDKKLSQFKDLLDKMLIIDYHQRISVSDALRHPFIQEPLNK